MIGPGTFARPENLVRKRQEFSDRPSPFRLGSLLDWTVHDV